ncbi:MAG: bifunctional ADP-dependent NAD(P)H-hydrate dehydratase/NAD(P)H-hydrate epimerase, partial [Clostridia bacterium]|nr:bifunctional ADP-dependent NAD(P)H-hydrate dehydratase/NAD(P)H-hydrate epimerase [Clostridia bacterium]
MMMRASEAMVREYLPPRVQETHKGDYGRLLCVCGALGYTGAAYFCAQSAVVSGAGLIDLVVPESIYAIEAIKLNEAMVHGAAANADGMFAQTAIPSILSRAAVSDAVVIGCG